jgi:hypothetical protein
MDTERMTNVLALESRYFALGGDLLALRKGLKNQFGTDKVGELSANQFKVYEADLPRLVENQRYERWKAN